MSLRLKTLDTKDIIQYTITSENGTKVDLTDATVKFVMAKKGTVNPSINKDAEIIDAVNGLVQYQFSDADTIEKGNYNAEFQVTFSDDKQKSYPTVGYLNIVIQSNLDGSQPGQIEERIIIKVSEIEQFKEDIDARAAAVEQTVIGVEEARVSANSAADRANNAAEVAETRITELEGVDAVQFDGRLNDVSAQLAQTMQDFNEAVAAVTEDSEVVLARDGETILDERISKIEDGTRLRPKAISPTQTTFADIGKNLFNLDKATNDVYLNQGNGTEIAFAGYKSSEFMEVKQGVTYNINAVRKFVRYNLNKTYITGFDQVQGNYTFTPTQDEYIRFSYQTSALNGLKVQMEVGATETEYEPYGYLIDRLKFTKPQENEIIKAANPKASVKVVKNGETFTLSSEFSVGKTIFIETKRNGSLNGSFNWVNTKVNEEIIHDTPDDITPVRTFVVVGGGHGYPRIVELTVSDHNKTTADLGSRWSDGITTYTLLKIEGSKLYFGMPYSVSNGIVSAPQANPTADLTHVRDATNTSSVSIANRASSTQLYPSINKISVKYIIDGKEIINDGEYFGEELQIQEKYNLMDYKDMVDYAHANIGQSYANDSVGGALELRNTFVYRKGLKCTTFHSMKILKPINFGRSGFLQSVTLSALISHTRKRFMPNVKVKSGFDFGTGINLDTYNTSLIFEHADSVSPTIPPNHYVDWIYDSNGNKKYGFSMGYIPDKTNTKNADRVANSPYTWDMRSSKKSYPIAIENKTVAAGSYMTFMGFRNYLSPEEVGEAVNASIVRDNKDTYIFTDFTQNVSGYSVELPEKLGKEIQVVQSENLTKLNETVDAGGVVLSVTNGYGNGVLKV